MADPDFNDSNPRITIAGQTFSGWIDYDRDRLKALSPDEWIQWMEARIPLALTGSLDRVYLATSPHHSVVNSQDFSFYLCGVTLVACAVEGLGHFMTGTSDAGASFRAWCTAYMPRWKSVVDWLWTDVRNGLAHQLSFKSGGIEHLEGRVSRTRQDGQIEMDPDAFYSDFKEGLTKFFVDLKIDQALKVKFAYRFQATFLT